MSPDNCVDQVILGTSDLDKAMDQFEAMTGVRPCIATSMNGAGTKSARVAFEECAYLEIIGPDAKQTETPLKKAVSEIPEGELVPIHYAVRFEKAKELEVRMEWKKMGMEYDQITMVSKDRGMPWLWDMFFIKGDGKDEELLNVRWYQLFFFGFLTLFLANPFFRTYPFPH